MPKGNLKKPWPADARAKDYWNKNRKHRYREQCGVCAICGSTLDLIKKNPKTKANLDHNHETGKIRGLLCTGCNNGLGLFQENPTRLLKAIQYLKYWIKH